MIIVRNRKTYSGPGVQITRGNPLGNPYVIGRDGSRDEVIEKFRNYLWECMNNDGPVGEMIEELAGRVVAGKHVILICCCNPLPCHGNVIAAAVRWKIQQWNKTISPIPPVYT